MSLKLRLFLFGLGFLLGGLTAAPDARADKVDRLINQLRGASSYKVRLSAALSLTKLGDPRALGPMVRALRDREKTIRGVAAAGLAKLVDERTPAKRRARVQRALRRTIQTDKNSFVRRQAQKAYNRIESLGSSGGGRGSLFVDVGSMGDKTGRNGALRTLMRKTVAKTFQSEARGVKLRLPGSSKPARKSLRQMSAYHVDGTITSLEVSSSGRSSQVACKVSMLIATYPEKSMFGFLKGGAQVTTGSSSRDVQYGKQDCVAAVIADLVARKVIPTLESRSQ